MKHYTVALLGNPNVGKSAWINLLTHADFKVGNWPGVTIEKKEARVYDQGCCYHFIDLPGIYSLSEDLDEGRICTSFLKEHHVDLILDICDSTCLGRSLRLCLALRELQIPMVVICGFADTAEKLGITIDQEQLSDMLQLPVRLLSARRKCDANTLWTLIRHQVHGSGSYDPLFDPVQASVARSLAAQLHETDELRRNEKVYAFMRGEQVEGASAELEHWQCSRDPDAFWNRYDTLIETLLERCVTQQEHVRYTIADRILLHPLLALPLCALFLIWMLQMVFSGSAPWSELIMEICDEYVCPWLLYHMEGIPQVLQRFLTEGVVRSAASVISFVPLMGCLYFWLAFLEESGYMARIAFLADRVMSYFHLSGKALIAMVLGFGCNVPGIMATRALESEKRRRLAALLVPFMSCGARLPLYLLFAASFFRGKEAIVVASLYGIGLLIAFAAALILSRMQYFHEERIQVMELPPYRLPSFSVMGKTAFHEMIAYLRKACSVVLIIMMSLWCLSYLPSGERESSYLANASRSLSFVFAPLGFGDSWECVASLPAGIAAKESIVAFLQASQPEMTARPFTNEDISRLLSRTLECAKAATLLQKLPAQKEEGMRLWEKAKDAPLRAYSFLVFVLLSIPCMMTLSALLKLYGRRIMWMSVGMMIILPYLASLFLYQFMHFLQG